MQTAEQTAVQDLMGKRQQIRGQYADLFQKGLADQMAGALKSRGLNAQLALSGLSKQATIQNQAATQAYHRAVLQERKRVDNAKLNQARAQGAKPSASLSKLRGFMVDGNGNPILGTDGKRIPILKTATAGGSKQASTLARALAAGTRAAISSARMTGVYKNPFTGKPQGGHVTKNYEEALNIVAGVLADQAPFLGPAQRRSHAVRIVNRYYGIGVGGRKK